MTDTAKRPAPPRRLLVHMCCGPCSIFPLKKILGPEVEVWGYFHNPNIHPYGEFRKRLESTRKLARLMGLEVICDEEYHPRSFISGLKAHADTGKFPAEGKRCEFCYTTRLEAVARAASEGGFDGFSSTLLYSTYQDHDGIKRYAEDLAEKYGLEFIYGDFREGWQEGIEKSKEMGLYRQKYCGCIYSRMERDMRRKAREERKKAVKAERRAAQEEARAGKAERKARDRGR